MVFNLEWPRLEIETNTTSENLARMVSRIEAGFRRLGATEPHWSVLTHEKYTAANIEANKEEFYQFGAMGVEVVRKSLERVGYTMAGTAFELGCGVGRSTIPLARHFTKVYGSDISATHLQVASEAALSRGAPNIEWLLVDRLSAFDAVPEFDFFFSVIVFQHNPPPVMTMMLRKLLSKLTPGGYAYFQIPTYIAGYRFESNEYLAHDAPEIQMHCIPQMEVFRIVDLAGCRVLECREDTAAGDSNQILSNTFIVQRRD